MMGSAGLYSYISSIWFFSMWELYTISDLEGSLHSKLGKWHFPRVLANGSNVLAKVKKPFQCRPEYIIVMFTQNDQSHPQQPMMCAHQFSGYRWKTYNPLEFGGTGLTKDPDSSTTDGATDQDAIPSLEKLHTNIRDHPGTFLSWLIVHVIICGLFYLASYFYS